MDPDNDSDDLIHDYIKIEVEQNMQIDEEVSEHESYLQQRVYPYESTSQREQDGPSNYYNPDLISDYNDIQGLNEQEHYNKRSISQITAMATVQLERLPIGLIKNINRKDNNKDKDDKYSCQLCNFETNVRRLFMKHQSQHDAFKKYECDICQYRFTSHYHLSRHKGIHGYRSIHYHCSFCDFETTNKLSMDKHENLHGNFKRFPCLNGCQRVFKTKALQSGHYCTKYSRKCEFCGKTFKYEASYRRHLDSHGAAPTPPTVYNCSLCYKSFDTKKKCSNHYRMHRPKSKIRKYTCQWCNKIFSDPSNRSKHMKLHIKYEKKTKQRKYKQDPDSEVEIHTMERREDEKFVCSLCPKLFDTQTELGQHAVDHIL